MAGLLPGLLPNLGISTDVPLLGPLLGDVADATSTTSRDVPPETTSAPVAERTTASSSLEVETTSLVAPRPLTTFVISSTPDTNLPETEIADTTSTSALITTIPITSSISITSAPAIPSSSISAPLPAESSTSETSSSAAALMPALPISLGIVGGVIILGIVLGTLYRKSKWPFARRRRFDQLEDEIEWQQSMTKKWDPRASTWARQPASNF